MRFRSACFKLVSCLSKNDPWCLVQIWMTNIRGWISSCSFHVFPSFLVLLPSLQKWSSSRPVSRTAPVLRTLTSWEKSSFCIFFFFASSHLENKTPQTDYPRSKQDHPSKPEGCVTFRVCIEELQKHGDISHMEHCMCICVSITPSFRAL